MSIDVVLDLRKNEPPYGKTFVIELSEKSKTQLFVPKGFAHGFKTLEDHTIFYYKCSDFYNKASEGAIFWNDETLNIPWDVKNPIISDKDKIAENFKDFKSLF